MKVKKRIQQEYHILTKKKHNIIQLFTKHKTNVKCGQMQIS